MNSFLIDNIFKLAIEQGASDIHLQVGYPIYLRVNGELIPIGSNILTNEYVNNFFELISNKSQKDRFASSHEIDFAYEFIYESKIFRFRTNVFHSRGSKSIVLRLIPSVIKTPSELGLPENLIEYLSQKQGFILCVGPTGSGKSTTLASLINYINTTKSEHIITVEDPIEFVYPKATSIIAQRELGSDTISYEAALESILREDPNVVLIQELRNSDTMRAALTVAETGHLVFGTLHTNSAVETIQRLIYSFPDSEQKQVRTILASVISVIISQRLVKTVKGGRKIAIEILVNTPAVANMIRDEKEHQIDNVIRTSSELGMISMEKSLVNLIRNGDITLEMAEKYTTNVDEILRHLRSS